MKNCIYEPVFGLFLLFNFQIDSALTFSSRLSYVILLQHRVSLLISSPLDKRDTIVYHTHHETARGDSGDAVGRLGGAGGYQCGQSVFAVKGELYDLD